MNTTHEDFRREIRTRGPSNRSFGGLFSAAFLVFGLWPLYHGNAARVWCLALGGAILLVTLFRPSLLHWPNLVWGKVGILLGRVVNPVITGILFYLVFTPLAMILRWRGKDLLHLRFDPDAKSYWMARHESGNESGMSDQF
jgi:hypothetical protein